MMPRRWRKKRNHREKMKQNTNDNHLEINLNVVAGFFSAAILLHFANVELKMSEKMGNKRLQFLYVQTLAAQRTGNMFLFCCVEMRRSKLFHFHSMHCVCTVYTQLHCVYSQNNLYKTINFQYIYAFFTCAHTTRFFICCPHFTSFLVIVIGDVECYYHFFSCCYVCCWCCCYFRFHLTKLCSFYVQINI